jgi:hypothetical protein
MELRTEAEESSLLEAVTKEQLVKTQQTEIFSEWCSHL